MNQVLAIGVCREDVSSIPEIQEENSIFDSGMCIVQLKNKQQVSNVISKLSRNNIECYCIEKFYETIRRGDSEYVELHRFGNRDFIPFRPDVHSSFVAVSDGGVSVFDMSYEHSKEVVGLGAQCRCVMSDDGMFICLYDKNWADIRGGRELQMFNRMEFAEDIVEIKFCEDSKYIGVVFSSRVEVWDIFRSERMCVGNGNRIRFHGDVAMVGDTWVQVGDWGETTMDSRVKKMASSGRQTMRYVVESGYSSIEYRCCCTSRSKRHTNISSVRFDFSRHRGFGLICKKIGDGEIYFVESYNKEGITMNRLEGGVREVSVCDNVFVVSNTENNITFYRKDRYGFSVTVEIQKEDDVMIRVSGEMCCVYDSYNNNIEFYDSGKLRSIYPHERCDDITWSYGGVYLGSVSYGSSGMIQVFTSNGKMVLKRIFHNLSYFGWRRFKYMDFEDKVTLVPELDDDHDDAKDEEQRSEDKEQMKAKWKEYLQRKRDMIRDLPQASH